MHPKHALALLCLAGAMVLSPDRASAQEPRISDTEDGYAVEFRDSNLLGQTLSLGGLLIPIRDTSPRVLLIRPRTSFVPELLKSVEHF